MEYCVFEDLDSPAVCALQKLSNIGRSLDGLPKIYYILELLRAPEGTLSRWSRLHLQSLVPTNPHRAWWVIARSP
jgi:hypothetical protein